MSPTTALPFEHVPPPPSIRIHSSPSDRQDSDDLAQEQAPLQNSSIDDSNNFDSAYEELDVSAVELATAEINTSTRCFHPGPCHHGPLDDAMQSMLLDLLTTVERDGDERGEEVRDLSLPSGEGDHGALEEPEEMWEEEEEMDFGTALYEYGETSTHVTRPLWRFEAEDEGTDEGEEEKESDFVEGSSHHRYLSTSALEERDTSMQDGAPTFTMVSRQVTHKWSGLLEIVAEEVEESQAEDEVSENDDSEDEAVSEVHECTHRDGVEEGPRLYRPLSGVDWMEDDDNLPDLSDF